MTSSPHGPYRLGYTRATMAVTMGRKGVTLCKSQKAVSVRIVLELQTPIRTVNSFLRLASCYQVAALCTAHCSTCVAPDVRAMMT